MHARVRETHPALLYLAKRREAGREMSLSALARLADLDPTHLSRVTRARQAGSRRIAEALQSATQGGIRAIDCLAWDLIHGPPAV